MTLASPALACPDCQTPWTDPKAENCGACGTVAVAEIIAGIRRRHAVWNDAGAFEDWILRNAHLVLAGMGCRDCGSMMSGGKQPSGKPSKCVVCACGFGPVAPARKKRAPRPPKSRLTETMELLDG